MGYSIKELSVGQQASFAKTISESDIYLFAGVTGDINPAHLNEQYASQTIFKGRIAHGMLSASLISAVLGVQLPGTGTIYMSQEVKFLAPVRAGDTITATVDVVALDIEKNIALLRTTCINQEGVQVVDGQARVKPPPATESHKGQVPK